MLYFTSGYTRIPPCSILHFASRLPVYFQLKPMWGPQRLVHPASDEAPDGFATPKMNGTGEGTLRVVGLIPALQKPPGPRRRPINPRSPPVAVDGVSLAAGLEDEITIEPRFEHDDNDLAAQGKDTFASNHRIRHFTTSCTYWERPPTS